MKTLETFFPPLDGEAQKQLERLGASVETCFPVPGRFSREIYRNIAELSRLLTADRERRKDGYLGSARVFSAYSRYFLPWNVLRLCRLFSSPPLSRVLEALFDGKDGAALADWGAGPFSVPLALWIAVPALRDKPLDVYALDHVKNALTSGERLFRAFAGDAWKVNLRAARLETLPRLAPARLITAAYVLNELFWKIPQADTAALERGAQKTARRLVLQAAEGGAILIVEPGIPRSAQYLAFLKEAFAREGFFPRFPCPAAALCPMRGGRKGAKWCHFTLDTAGAPAALEELSARSGLPKEKATLSFLFLQKGETGGRGIRVISAPFALDGGAAGRYGCAREGLILIRGTPAALRALPPGTLLCAPSSPLTRRDAKSGAFIVELAAGAGDAGAASAGAAGE